MWCSERHFGLSSALASVASYSRSCGNRSLAELEPVKVRTRVTPVELKIKWLTYSIQRVVRCKPPRTSILALSWRIEALACRAMAWEALADNSQNLDLQVGWIAINGKPGSRVTNIDVV